MRKLLIVLLMLIAGVAHARILHIGENTIKLSQTKTTNPALHVRVEDEIWYGKMSRCFIPMNENTDKKLKIKHNDIEYYVSELDEIKDYLIVDGKLIGANCNIYLETTGTQWIDPEIKFTDYTAFETLISFTRTDIDQIIGVGGSYVIGGSIRVYKDLDEFVWIQSDCCENNSFLYGRIDTKRHFMKNDLYNKFFQLDSQHIIPPNSNKLKATYNFYIGTYSRLGSPDLNWAWYTKIHFFKFYVSDVLVRHFVPVPCGLKIGDFIVPSNGMWDIVEQKFYGNIGTGEFIYGIDN